MEPEQLEKFMASLDQMAQMITEMRGAMGGADSADEQAETVDAATAEQEGSGMDEDSLNEDTGQGPEVMDDKKLRKSAAVAMLRKSL